MKCRLRDTYPYLLSRIATPNDKQKTFGIIGIFPYYKDIPIIPKAVPMALEPIIIQQQQQVSREELARSKQAITELQYHYDNYESQLRLLQNNMTTEEDAVQYASLMLELNRCRDNLNRHITSYNQLIQLANVQFPSTRLGDQAKREIYHFYHSGRYTQVELASQYGVQQSTISKIVNGPQPS
ncbi:hypothetical protein GCM10022421_10500 [Oceanisphaera sediminis]|uniref:HTH cro/C1-type domain-containing protein n=2 Tax=Oceanisphaera sediminis TaxID=981381 RepID=A0ABP7DJ24_9GAMM